MSGLDRATARRLVGQARVGRLATVTGDGHPHVVPCCFARLGERAYSVVDGKPKSTTMLKRLDNVRANPAASLLVDRYDDDWTRLWWVRLDGTARVVGAEGERAEALAALVDRYPQYREDRPQGPMLAIDIGRWTAWAFRHPG
jgi:PPOX class probable F420-dependent enzyme